MSNSPEWSTISIEIPDFIETTRDAINSVAEFLTTMLDIVLAALQLAKAFATAYLDPIMALIQQIIDELNSLIQDIRQMGIYLTGDWNLFDYPFTDLRGGYSEYERRMISRLTDKTDPTRPDVSGNTTVFGLFLYLSVDISEIQRLIAFLMRMVSFFKQDWNANVLPPVEITEVSYGLDAVNPQSIGETFKQLAGSGLSGVVPDIAQIRFKTNVPNKNYPFVPYPSNMLGPDGFIVTVSTIPDGIKLYCDKPTSDTTTKTSINSPGSQVQPRTYDLVRGTDGKPVVLFGGSEMINLPDSLTYNQNTIDGKPVSGGTRIYGYLDPTSNVPVPIESMGNYFQKTFYIDHTQVAYQSSTGEYTFSLNLDDMPLDGDIVIENGKAVIKDGGQNAGVAYIRVAACHKNAIGKFKYDLNNAKVISMAASPGYIVAPQPDGIDVTDVGPWSNPEKIAFPGAYTDKYLQAVQSALIVLVLCRPDLVTSDDLTQVLTQEQIEKIESGYLIVDGTAKIACGLESLRSLLRVLFDGVSGPDDQWKKSGESPLDFRRDLSQRIRRFTQDLYNRTGHIPEVEKHIVENTENLRNIKWGDVLKDSDLLQDVDLTDSFLNSTLLGSFDTNTIGGSDLESGVALNPWCVWGLSSEKSVYNAMRVDGLVQGRSFMYTKKTGDVIQLKNTVKSDEIDDYLITLPVIIKNIYESQKRDDKGDINIDISLMKTMNDMLSGLVEGSGDRSPVIYTNPNDILQSSQSHSKYNNASIVYARSLLVDYDSGSLIKEVQTALSVAGGLWERNDDGSWVAIRFLDVFPEIDNFLGTVKNWVDAIKKSTESIVDTIEQYIEWLEARIMETQQLIRRINSLIQSLLGHLFQVPACSALLCMSNGTDGLVSDLVSSQFKPDDGALAYGAGLALVVPAVSSFAYQLLLQMFVKSDIPLTTIAGQEPPAGIPLNGLGGSSDDSDNPPDIL